MTSLDDLAGLANINSSLMPSQLTLHDIASSFAVSGRASLVAKLRAAGLAAGHAGKVANAVAKCVREGRIAGMIAPEAALPIDLDLHAAAAAGNADRVLAILQEHPVARLAALRDQGLGDRSLALPEGDRVVLPGEHAH